MTLESGPFVAFIHQAIDTLGNLPELLQTVNSEGVLEIFPETFDGQNWPKRAIPTYPAFQ